ncbi:hypothetical protein [Spiroplasma tabanidicola]|uniref:Uncharacterized protein n=1 Tax=Spiroplasma tabanidicola TaxID=324079 RepID=A0A6I6C7V1_9MOLU|nr:hypothetical protein [Spiroplasma tabanidicola]QGS52300.1 hypothetical protein STABA_v1c09470 [Spiroplasma tabanidicola]
MKVLLKCNIKQIFKLKSIYILYGLLTLVNIVSYSLLLFIGKNEDQEIKIKQLQIGFYFFIINLFFIVIFTLLINTSLFYNALYGGKTNMEIVSGINKKTIWLSRFITQKIIILGLIFIQVFIVNTIMIKYDQVYQSYLINQRLFYWLYLLFFSFFLDFVYQFCLSFISQQAFVATIMFVVGLIFSISLICNYFFKSDDINGIGLVKSNKAYRKIELTIDNYNSIKNFMGENTSNFIKDWHKLGLMSYIENNLENSYYSQQVYLLNATNFYDSFIDRNEDNIFMKFILEQYEILSMNNDLFKMSYKSLLDMNNLYDNNWQEVPIMNEILENFYNKTNNKSYLNFLNNYKKRFEYEKLTLSNGSFLYSNFKNPSYYFDENNGKYNFIKAHPEIALLIDFYSNIVNEFYDLKKDNNINSYIYELYIEQTNLNESFYDSVRFNYFNQMSKMAYGFKDSVYADIIANQPFGPLSDLYYKRLVNEPSKLDKYRTSVDYHYSYYKNINNNYKFSSDFFALKKRHYECFLKENLTKTIYLADSLVMSYEPLNSFFLKNWTIVYHLTSSTDNSKEIFVPINEIYSDSVKYINGKINIESVYMTQYLTYLNNDRRSYSEPTSDDLILYSKNYSTEFMGSEFKINNDYNIDIYSDGYFNEDKKGELLNYYALYIPWLVISVLLDFGTIFIFVKRYEKMW